MIGSRFSFAMGCVVCALLTGGCGGSGLSEPKLAQVSGTIKVDGKPEPDLQVVFEPQMAGSDTAADIGGSSIAMTDENGHYELKYKGGSASGAVVGKHIVRINRAGGGGPAGGENAVASSPLPATYNEASTLTAEIKDGENKEVNFEVTAR